MISRYLVYAMFFLGLPMLVAGQTSIEKAIKNGKSLKIEWVQQGHLQEAGTIPNPYPLYPDQLKNGEWEIRIGLEFSSDKDDTIKGSINYISYIRFPQERRVNYPQPPADMETQELVRKTKPIIVDSRFQEEYFSPYLFLFELLQDLAFTVSCDAESVQDFLNAYQRRLENAMDDIRPDIDRWSEVVNKSLPTTFVAENLRHFICSILSADLPSGESFSPLQSKIFGEQLLNNFFRVNYPPKKTIIHGQIRGQATSEVRLKFYKQDNWLEFRADTVLRLDKTGNFKLNFPLTKALTLEITHGYKTMRFYMEPGDSLAFTTNANAFYREMTFEGATANSQQFLLDFFHEMRGDTFFRMRDYQFLAQDQLSFLEKNKGREKRELRFLQEYKLELPPAFVSYIDRSIRLHYAGIIWEGALRFYRDKDLYLEPPLAYHAERLRSLLYRLPPDRVFDFSIQRYLSFQSYRLNGFYRTSARYNWGNFSRKNYELANFLLNKETLIRHYARLLPLEYQPTEGLGSRGMQRLNQLLEICKDSAWIKKLFVLSKPGAGWDIGPYSYRILQTGRKAPDWNFSDRTGRMLSLRDFRNKKLLLQIGWSQNIESALIDIEYFQENQGEIPEVVHLINAPDKKEFELATLDREGLFLYVPTEEMQVLQDSYRLDNTTNHYYLIDENGVVIANNFELGTPTQMRGTWSTIATAPNESWTVEERLSFWRGLGLGGFALLLISLIYLWRKRLTAKRELRKQQLLELELKGIRAQMNPHFLFNAMSSIQNLIRKNEQEKADTYLSQFAGLMRRTLRNSREEFIPLSEELEMIKQYCSLEALRNPIQFEFEVDPNIDQQNTYIPSMILQPIIENAIIHGLLPKRGHRALLIKIQHRMEGLRCTITDNGIGVDTTQTQKQAQSKGRKSLGLKLVNQRLALLSVNGANQVVMTDRSRSEEGLQGTQVTLIIPVEQ